MSGDEERPGGRAGLTSTDASRLAALARGWGRRLAGSGAAPAEPPAPIRHAADFSTLPAYQDLLKQRAAADLAGLVNPFFRLHETRAGATTIIDGREVVNFCSYDYLGLNGHQGVSAAHAKAAETYGTSASASRLVAGERPVHRALETALAGIYGTEDAIAFVSGHATNVAVISTMLGPGDLVVYDALAHNSIVVGAELSGAARIAFPHNDLEALERTLKTSRGRHRNVLVAVEGHYSMDGDVPELARIADIKDRHGAWLMVDEAHALGVLGRTGKGLHEEQDVNPARVEIWMGTLSKTLAACGGYVAGSTALVELLKYTAPGFVYSVGLSPPLAAAATAALGLMAAEPERVAHLRTNGALALKSAKAAGLDTLGATGFSILPIRVGDSLRAVKLSERLLARGYNILPIVFPAVPMQQARLRVFLTSAHTPAMIEGAIAAIAEELRTLEAEGFGLSKAAALLAGRT